MRVRRFFLASVSYLSSTGETDMAMDMVILRSPYVAVSEEGTWPMNFRVRESFQ